MTISRNEGRRLIRAIEDGQPLQVNQRLFEAGKVFKDNRKAGWTEHRVADLSGRYLLLIQDFPDLPHFVLKLLRLRLPLSTRTANDTGLRDGVFLEEPITQLSLNQGDPMPPLRQREAAR